MMSEPAEEIPVVWVQIHGELKQISFDGIYLAGVNDADDVFVANEDIRSKPKWRKISGKLKNVCVHGAALYGTNSGNAVFFGRVDGRADNWRCLPGLLNQVSFDGSQIVGAVSETTGYHGWENLTVAPNWHPMTQAVRQVTVFSDRIYGVNSNEELWYSSLGPWVKLECGLFKQIAYDGNSLLGLDRGGTAWFADKDLSTAPNFKPLSPSTHSFKYVDINDKEIFAVDVYNKIFYANLNLPPPTIVYD